MKILVADDDPVARTLLKTFLEKSGYAVRAVADGTAALAELVGPDAPQVAVLDWMMPGFSGPEVCARLRAADAKIRAYVMLLTAKSEKPDIAAGLDAGADEFLSKPFNPVELLARLRVAQRTIQYQVELQRHIGSLESLVQRYNLLGEIAAQQGGLDAPAPNPANGPASLNATEIDAIARRVLGDFGLELARGTVTRQQGPRSIGTFSAWAGILLVREQRWFDLLLECDEESAAIVFEKALKRRPVSDREILNFLAETHTILSSAVRAALIAQGAEVLSPFLSRALRTDSLLKPPPLPIAADSHAYELPGCQIRLGVARRPCPARPKTQGQLREMDILAESFPPSETVGDMPLLNQGVVLNERFIEKLSGIARPELQKLPLSVFEPSDFAGYFWSDQAA